jgi:hypothetical protein
VQTKTLSSQTGGAGGCQPDTRVTPGQPRSAIANPPDFVMPTRAGMTMKTAYLMRPISRSFSTTLPIMPKYGFAVERSRIDPSESRTISIDTGSAGSN